MEKWEKEFDRIFVDENVWQGEDDYTKNVPIGNIKKFIESLLEERDTYWKERVKTLKKADQIIIHKTLGGGYVCFNPSLVYPANTKIQPVFGKTPEDALSHHLQALDNLK